MTKPWMLIGFGLLVGLLVTGAILLIARPAQGVPVTLHPAPSPTSTSLPSPTSTPTPIMLQIAGEVNAAGTYALTKGARLEDLIDMAGGLTDSADSDNINLVSPLRDGEYYYIPAVGETIPETAANSPMHIQAGGELSVQYPLNLNTATQEELETLPGIGPSKAADILAYRDEHGPFQSVDDLASVSGIGPSTIESLRDYLIVE